MARYRNALPQLGGDLFLTDGDPVELAGQYRDLVEQMPWVNIFGGCCGTDLRHVRQIARQLRGAIPA